MLFRWLAILFALGVFAGCGQKKDLPEITVAANDPSDFARFSSELRAQFPAERLKDFDTAVNELKLDAMNRNVATAEAREQDMVNAVKNKTVHAATLLGWQARRARFAREIAFIDVLLQGDLKQQAKTAATGVPPTVTARIRSAQEMIARLQISLDETERRLTEWGVALDKTSPAATIPAAK
ncbi:hypothetical protein [Oleiharenicola lentus]|uniref:hypothetical protein n=1 Tax=Oleiharenicola lentus TaxID=2508720 RepID=UPI003F6765F4